MSSTANIITTLDSVTYNFSISSYLFVLIFGIIGNIFNVIVFASLKTFWKNPCAFCLLILSISGSGMLLFSTVPLMLTDILQGHGGLNGNYLCKISIAFAQTFCLISHSIVCLAAIDQCSSTSMHERRKGMSLSLTRGLIIIFLFVSILHGIPFLIYYDTQILPGTNITLCVLKDKDEPLSKFLLYVDVPIVAGLVPIFIMSVCALIAFHNVRTMTKRRVNIIRLRLEQQLTAMVLMKIFSVSITVIPFIIIYILQYIISLYNSNPIVQKQLLLANRVGTFLLLINFAVSIIFSWFI